MLCLNHGQVAFGAPDETLTTDVLRATYGDELVILDGSGQAVTVSHHSPRPLMLSSGIMQRAFVEAIVLGARVRAARRLDPAAAARVRGGVALARDAARARDRGAGRGAADPRRGGRRARRGGRDRAGRPDARAGGDVGVAVVVSGLFGLGGILALSPETPPRLGELLFGDLLGVTDGDLVAAAVLCAGVLIALAVGYRSLTATGVRPRQRRGARHPARRAPTSRCSRCWP